MSASTFFLLAILIAILISLIVVLINRVIGDKVTLHVQSGDSYWWEVLLVYTVCDTTQLRLVYMTVNGKKRRSDIHKIERKQFWQHNRIYTAYRKRKLLKWAQGMPNWTKIYVTIEST